MALQGPSHHNCSNHYDGHKARCRAYTQDQLQVCKNKNRLLLCVYMKVKCGLMWLLVACTAQLLTVWFPASRVPMLLYQTPVHQFEICKALQLQLQHCMPGHCLECPKSMADGVTSLSMTC